jgi:hypothetical protein
MRLADFASYDGLGLARLLERREVTRLFWRWWACRKQQNSSLELADFPILATPMVFHLPDIEHRRARKC